MKFEKEIKAYWKTNKPAKKACATNGIRKEYTKDEEGEKVYTGFSLIVFKTGITFPDGKAKVVSVHNAKGDKV